MESIEREGISKPALYDTVLSVAPPRPPLSRSLFSAAFLSVSAPLRRKNISLPPLIVSYSGGVPRYAAIDIGSNSIRMEAAEVAPGQPIRVLASDREVTRLGESVFRNGSVS